MEGLNTSFFSFEKKKLILPLLFILLFIYSFSILYSASSILDQEICKIRSLSENINSALEKNNSQLLENSISEFEDLLMEISPKMEKIDGNEWVLDFFKISAPFFPLPCEISNVNFCKNYISEKSYICLHSEEKDFPLSGLFKSLPPYEKVSIWMIFFQVILMIGVWYLISCLILFGYRKIKSFFIKN